MHLSNRNFPHRLKMEKSVNTISPSVIKLADKKDMHTISDKINHGTCRIIHCVITS